MFKMFDAVPYSKSRSADGVAKEYDAHTMAPLAISLIRHATFYSEGMPDSLTSSGVHAASRDRG